MEVFEEAKNIMAESGNPHQWGPEYPHINLIREDIRRGVGYVCRDDQGRILAYFAFMYGPEPTYATIKEGEWLDQDKNYYVLHRLAKKKGEQKVFDIVIRFCSSIEPNIRVDTHRDNAIMRHCLSKYGFVYCGIINLDDGQERIAFQRIAAS